MRTLHVLCNYLCYCGIEKEEYNALKKSAYISNFKVWRLLHCLIAGILAGLFINSLFNPLLTVHRIIYLSAFLYYALMTGLFFVLKKDSIVAQLLIYLSMSLLFLLSAFLTRNKPEFPATSFVVMLLITPMFMIDKPFFMGIELGTASAVFLIWMYYEKPLNIWQMDLINIVVFSVAGFVVHIISNSIRIREFVLAKELSVQKDTDDLTGLKNKGALTRAINAYLTDETKDKGILFILDIDHFKDINDTYGHDVGDSVIRQLGGFLGRFFTGDEIVGRFGGDEFIFFIRDADNTDAAAEIAKKIVSGASKSIVLPDREQVISVSVGIAIYRGEEKNYSELFKKADIALYQVKSNRVIKYQIYE